MSGADHFVDVGLKKRFAELWIKLGDPGKAAWELFADKAAGDVLRVKDEWPKDETVLGFRNALLASSSKNSNLPEKEEVAEKVWAIAQNAEDDEVALKACQEYSKLMGYIEKPREPVVENKTINIDQRRVMIVRSHGDDDEWENKLLEQQRKLTSEAA